MTLFVVEGNWAGLLVYGKFLFGVRHFHPFILKCVESIFLSKNSLSQIL